MKKANSRASKTPRPPRVSASASAPRPAEPTLDSMTAVERQELEDLRNTVATLYAREALLDAVIQSLPIWITVKDANNRYLLVNQAMAEANGNTPDKFVGKLDRDVLALDQNELDALDTLNHMVMASGKPVERPSYVMKLPDGTEQVRRMIKLPLHDSDGATLGVIGWSEDITQRVEVEESLDRNRRLLQALVEIMPHAVSYIDRDRKLRMVNRAWCNLVGMTREQALGKTILEIETLPLAARQAMWKDNDIIYESGKTVPTAEFAGIGRDGHNRIAQVTKAPLMVGGNVDGLVALSIDVTDMRTAEQQATLARQRMHDALESIPAAIYLYDNEDKLILANTMAKSLYPTVAHLMKPGTTFTQLVSEVAAVIIEDQQDRAQFIDRRLREFRHMVRQVEQRGPNGEYLLGHDRRTTEGGTVSIRFDITDQKRIQQELEERERTTRAELMLAGQVQRNILQELKPRPFIGEAHVFRPSSFVSGDIFHSDVAGDGSFLFFLGDATGHGVSAALITMLVKATLAAMPDDMQLNKMAELLNERLVAYSLDGMYMSGIFLRITPGGELTFCNAGHPAALVLGPGKNAKLESSGPPMGWFDVTGYESGSLRLAAGDKVVVLTDGLTEWANVQGEQLGSATVERVARENAEHSSAVVLEALLGAAKDHGVGEQGDDDLSLFVFEYRPRFG